MDLPGKTFLSLTRDKTYLHIPEPRALKGEASQRNTRAGPLGRLPTTPVKVCPGSSEAWQVGQQVLLGLRLFGKHRLLQVVFIRNHKGMTRHEITQLKP